MNENDPYHLRYDKINQNARTGVARRNAWPSRNGFWLTDSTLSEQRSRQTPPGSGAVGVTRPAAAANWVRRRACSDDVLRRGTFECGQQVGGFARQGRRLTAPCRSRRLLGGSRWGVVDRVIDSRWRVVGSLRGRLHGVVGEALKGGAALCSFSGVEPQWLFWVLWTPHFFCGTLLMSHQIMVFPAIYCAEVSGGHWREPFVPLQPPSHHEYGYGVSRRQRAPQVRFTKRCAIAALRVRRDTQEL